MQTNSPVVMSTFYYSNEILIIIIMIFFFLHFKISLQKIKWNSGHLSSKSDD